MNDLRASQLAVEVYQYVFEMLDNELEFNGYQAGTIAYELEKLFRQEIESFVEEK